MKQAHRFSRTLAPHELGAVGGGDLIEYGIALAIISIINWIPATSTSTSTSRTAPTGGTLTGR